jgi:hypothetical protein
MLCRESALDLGSRPHCGDVIALNRNCAILDDASLLVHGHHIARGPDPVSILTKKRNSKQSRD